MTSIFIDQFFILPHRTHVIIPNNVHRSAVFREQYHKVNSKSHNSEFSFQLLYFLSTKFSSRLIFFNPFGGCLIIKWFFWTIFRRGIMRVYARGYLRKEKAIRLRLRNILIIRLRLGILKITQYIFVEFFLNSVLDL